MKKTNKLFKIGFFIGCFYATIVGSVYAQENALHLDGTNDYVDCGNDASLNITGTAITLEAWVYPTSFQPNVWQGNVINKAGIGQTGYMLRVGGAGQVNFNLGTNSWNEVNSATGVVSLNTWHHIAGSYDGTTMRLYVDGIELVTSALTSNIASSPNSLLLGEDPAFPGRFFPGRIDEVRVWNVTRTPAEIITDMNTNTCGTIPPNLIAYYRFNQGVANGNNTGLTTLNDEIGVNNGALTTFSLTGATSNWVDGTNLSSSVATSNTSICQGDSLLILGVYRKTAGTYTDSLLTSGGCDSLISTVLTVTPPPVGTSITSICQGDSLLILGVYRKTAGSFIDTLQTPSGCDSIFINVLTINPLPIVSIATFNPDTLCSGTAAITLPVGTPILGSYSGNGVNGGDFDPAISGVGSHFITYSFTDGNGCSNSDSTAVVVELCVGINENKAASNIHLFPNPAKDILTIHLNDLTHETMTMKLIDVTGKTIKNIVMLENTQNMRLDISDLNKGIYFLMVPTTGKNKVYKVTKL